METNFKVDVPSFALGYSAGKKKGGVELNIAYGDTPPEDASKLWVKTSEPNAVLISPEVEQTEVDGESYRCLPVEMPLPVYGSAVGVVGDKVYFVGGYADIGSSLTKTVITYDLETGEFEIQEDAIGTTFYNLGNACVGTKIYAFGGNSTSEFSDVIYCYDTETRVLTTLSKTLPVPLSFLQCCAKGKDIYIFGGQSSTVASGYNKSVMKFDTETEEIETVMNEFYHENSGKCVLVDDTIYMFGGTSSDYYIHSLNTVTLEKWRSDPNYIKRGSGYGVIGKNIYSFGAWKNNMIRKFSTETKKWEILPVNRLDEYCYQMCVSVGDKIYMFGGRRKYSPTATTATGVGYNDKVTVFSTKTPVPVVAENEILIKTKTSGDAFQITKSVKIGVESVYKGNAEGIGEPVEAALYKDGEWVTI